MSKTKIPWTEVTWNPVVGCTKIAAGCKNCYAERMARRLRAIGIREYADVIGLHGNWTGKVVCSNRRLDEPTHWRKPRKIFVCSMSDLFHKKVSFEFLDKIFDVMDRTRDHTYQLLTKRPECALEYYKATEAPVFWEHLWFGVSCSTQPDADKNILIALQIPAAVHYVSFEPLLEEIDLKWNIVYPSQIGLDWVIVGCEKLAGNKPGRFCDDEKQWWSACRSIVNQCKKAGVAVFVKQGPVNGKVSGEPKDWPEDLRECREYPS